MPKLEADGVPRAVASIVVAPTPAPRAFSMSPIAIATTAPAKTAPQDTREAKAGAPSGMTALPDATLGEVLGEGWACMRGILSFQATERSELDLSKWMKWHTNLRPQLTSVDRRFGIESRKNWPVQSSAGDLGNAHFRPISGTSARAFLTSVCDLACSRCTFIAVCRPPTSTMTLIVTLAPAQGRLINARRPRHHTYRCTAGGACSGVVPGGWPRIGFAEKRQRWGAIRCLRF